MTPTEQMREAAARLSDIAAKTLTKNAPMISRDTGVNQMFADLASAIRAIPISPQPVAVTVKPLEWDGHVAHTTFGSYAVHDCRGYGQTYRLRLPMGVEGHTVLDYGSELMFTTQELAKAAAQADYESRILAALTIHPADPLSDSRVKALVNAVKRLSAACDAMWNDDERLEENPHRFGQEYQIKDKHVRAISEAQQDLLAANRAIGGEA